MGWRPANDGKVVAVFKFKNGGIGKINDGALLAATRDDPALAATHARIAEIALRVSEEAYNNGIDIEEFNRMYNEDPDLVLLPYDQLPRRKDFIPKGESE